MAKQSGGVFGTVSMIVAFVVMGLFLYWLSIVSEPSEVAVAEEGEAMPSPAVSLGQFAMNPMAYMNTPADLDGVEVQEIIGAQAFFFALPDGSPYLVRLPAPTGTPGIQVAPGDRTRVTGQVVVMTDSVLQAWDAEGVFTNPAHRMAVGSVPSFLAAQTIQVTQPAGAAPAPAGTN
ncbi:MAG: hypothetical protein WEG36_14055 [Gemmatimonadota bacterium]